MSDETKELGIDLVMPRLDAFLGAMRAISDLEDFVEDNAKGLNSIEEDYVLQGKRLYPSVDPEVHRRAAGLVHGKVHERMNFEKDAKEKAAPEEEIKERVRSWAESIRTGLLEFSGEPAYFYKSARIWDHVGRSPLKSRLLRNSLLMGAVSDFEVLVSGLVRAFLRLRPQILLSSDQAYTFADLEPFSTIDEFRDHCAESLADGLLRAGFEDWMEWFDQKRKIKVPGVTHDAEALVEIFQRRHLLVHNGGVVNKYYISKVSGDHAPSLGQRLSVSGAYLKKSVDELTVAGVKLAFSLLQKLSSDAEARDLIGHLLENTSIDLLMEGRWRVVSRINDWHLGFVKDPARRLEVMVNRWLALKHLGEWESVATEVEEWDTTTLSGVYRLAKLALLDENHQAYSLARSLIASEELAKEEWQDWPLLDGVREYEAENIDERDRLWIASFRNPHSDSRRERPAQDSDSGGQLE